MAYGGATAKPQPKSLLFLKDKQTITISGKPIDPIYTLDIQKI